MQRSGVEDEAEEKQRNQDEDKAQEIQQCTQVDEDAGMRWSSQGDKAEEKHRSSDDEEPGEMQSRGDQDEAEHKQPRADEDMECPGLEHPGQNKKERPKRKDHKSGGRSHYSPDGNIWGGTSSRGRHPPDWSIWGQVAARRPGRAHPEQNKEQGQPPPGLEYPRTSGGRTPRTKTTATESKRSGHEGEAVEMPRSGVGDEAGRSRETEMRTRPRRCSDAHKWTRTRGRGGAGRGRGRAEVVERQRGGARGDAE